MPMAERLNPHCPALQYARFLLLLMDQNTAGAQQHLESVLDAQAPGSDNRVINQPNRYLSHPLNHSPGATPNTPVSTCADKPKLMPAASASTLR